MNVEKSGGFSHTERVLRKKKATLGSKTAESESLSVIGQISSSAVLINNLMSPV